jgi:hypothetical protein
VKIEKNLANEGNEIKKTKEIIKNALKEMESILESVAVKETK